jgi:hypothetical protein
MSGAAYIRTLINASMTWRQRLAGQGMTKLISSGQIPTEAEKLEELLMTFGELIRVIYDEDIHYPQDN